MTTWNARGREEPTNHQQPTVTTTNPCASPLLLPSLPKKNLISLQMVSSARAALLVRDSNKSQTRSATQLEPNCLLLHVRSTSHPVSTCWPETCSPQVCDWGATCLRPGLQVSMSARRIRRDALSSARAKRCAENLSQGLAYLLLHVMLSWVRPAAAPHSCSTKRSKPFKEATN